MKPTKADVLACLIAVSAILAGCGPTRSELNVKERERQVLEERSRREAEQSNKAITDMSKKMFGKKAVPSSEPEPAKKP